MSGPIIFIIQIMAAFLAFFFFAAGMRRIAEMFAGSRYKWINLVLMAAGIVVAVFAYRFAGEALS